MPMPPHTSPEADAGFEALLSIAGRKVCDGGSAREFVEWFSRAAPLLAPDLFAPAAGSADDEARLARLMGRALWNALPQPAFGWRTTPIPEPGRNDPCPCGSGRKYKQCCLGLPSPARLFRDMNLLRWVLDAFTQKAFAQIPLHRLDPDALADTARQWKEEGEDRRAIALLEPLFAEPASLDGRHEPVFDALLDAWPPDERPRKRRALVASLMEHADPDLAAAARQRMVTMLADGGKWQEAWALFAESLRRNPEHPAFAQLEVLLLLQQGRASEAAARAQFWAKNLRRRGPQLAEYADFIETMAAPGHEFLAEIARGADPDFDYWSRLVESAPAPQVHYAAEGSEDELALRADRRVVQVTQRWQSRFPVGKPMLVGLDGEADPVLDDPEGVASFLSSHPLAWQSFDVLDDLALALRQLGQDAPSWASLLRRVAHRGIDLLRQTLGPTRKATLPWGFLDNRPALRLVAQGIDAGVLVPGGSEDALALMRWMLELNPRDNHGYREPLAQTLLRSSRPEEALRVLEPYADDVGGSAADHVLALYLAGRTEAAAEMLASRGRWLREIRRALVSERYAKPRGATGTTVTVGGRDEAWFYREQMRDLWRSSGALAWLRSQPEAAQSEPEREPEAVPPPTALGTAAAAPVSEQEAIASALRRYGEIGGDTDWLHGLLVSVASAPRPGMPNEWIRMIFEGGGRPLALEGIDDANLVLGGLMRWHNRLRAEVTGRQAAAEPSSAPSARGADASAGPGLYPSIGAGGDAPQRAARWAAGFVAGFDRLRPAWNDVGAPRLKKLVDPIRQLAAAAQGVPGPAAAEPTLVELPAEDSAQLLSAAVRALLDEVRLAHAGRRQ